MRRCFFDSNVLVYSQDWSEPAKSALAQSLIAEAIDADEFVVSTQVLIEFYATAVRRKLLEADQALALVRLWSEQDTVPHTSELILSGLQLHQSHSVSMWDALIVQAALEGHCEVLLSEDLQHGRRFGELRIANPFIAGAAAHERSLAYARSKRGKGKRRSRAAAAG